MLFVGFDFNRFCLKCWLRFWFCRELLRCFFFGSTSFGQGQLRADLDFRNLAGCLVGLSIGSGLNLFHFVHFRVKIIFFCIVEEIGRRSLLTFVALIYIDRGIAAGFRQSLGHIHVEGDRGGSRRIFILGSSLLSAWR